MRDLLVNIELVYFIYVRKSTDVEDKQILSVAAQLAGAAQDLPPRQPINSHRYRHRKAIGKNPRSSKVRARCCKYYVDSLSENTKRGLRQKVRMGIFPSQAPVGYLNDSRTKTIVVEKKKSRIVRLAFEKYTKGNMRLEDVSNFLAKSGVTTRTGKRISKTKASFILSNPFYIGLFKYGGEIHEGKHEPIISKKLFDEAQEMLKFRGQPERKAKNEPQPYCGLISCASCGMMITAENKTKRQKNGNVHYMSTTDVRVKVKRLLARSNLCAPGH